MNGYIHVIYQGTVITPSDHNKVETYTGLTGGPFKTRYNAHMSSFRNLKKKTETTLSHYIWDLKQNNMDFTVTWKILERGRGYNQTSKSCRLCLLEKHHIIFDIGGATLNRRSELFSHCRHRDKLKLKLILLVHLGSEP